MASFRVEIDDYDLKDEGYHHTDDCEKACTTCPSGDEPDPALAATDALHDWHETAHGYTLWSGCRQEPCNALTLDYRKRS